MNVLIVHQNFPGQFPHLADALLARGDKVAAIGGPTARGRPGVDLRKWNSERSSTKDIYAPAVRAEADLIRSVAAAQVAVALKKDGFVPDVIVGHPGWGETLHLREIFPAAKQVLLGEYYYIYHGGDVNFDREFEQPSLAGAMRNTGKSATQALALTMADLIICPTPFQASTFPEVFQPRIRIQHEGLDLEAARRRPDARVQLSEGRWVDRSTPVITFINRGFERLRGFHIFMRALPAFLDAVPDAQVIAIGADTGGYGSKAPDGRYWRHYMLDELGARLDQDRVHFVGQIPHDRMIDIFSIGAAHVYYTYPFVLSWSLIEAMACECLILGSDTAPVRDAIEHGRTGLLLPFFDVDALSKAMIAAVRDGEALAPMRAAARATALERFDRRTGMAVWLELIDQL
jgi:glycosyltransferase involved in cell wall biosynthesis